MSDRGNVVFTKDGVKSVVISAYEGGKGFVSTARSYATELKVEVDGLRKDHPNSSGPLERLEPEIIAVDFIHWLCENGWIDDRDSGIYLYQSEENVYGSVIEIDLENPQQERGPNENT